MLPFAPWVFGTAAIALAYLPALAALSLPLVVLASVVLGAGYGITQFAGLAEIQHIADPRSLGTATAAYQILSYTGFAFPFVMALIGSSGHLSPPTLRSIIWGGYGVGRISAGGCCPGSR